MPIKLDELVRGVDGARTGLVDVEIFTTEQLARLQARPQHLRAADQPIVAGL